MNPPIEETLVNIIMEEIGNWTLDELCQENSRRDLANRCEEKVEKVIEEHVQKRIAFEHPFEKEKQS